MGQKKANAAHDHVAAEARAANDTAFDRLLALAASDTPADDARLRRHVMRRRRQLKLPSDEAYLDHVRRNPDEMLALQEALGVATPAPHDAGLLQLVIDAVPALVAYVDPGGIFRWVNRQYGEWFDIDRQAIIGRSFRDVVGEAIYTEAAPRLARALQGEPVHWTRRVRQPSGSVRWVQVVYTPDADASGAIRGVVATVRDITAEREAEQALQVSEARANQVFETTPHALVVVDSQGRIERANRRAGALFGCPLARLIDQPIERYLPDGIADAEAIADSTGGLQQALRADGTAFPAQVNVGRLDSSFIVAVQDVTLQTEAQRVLAEHQSELERQVHERSAAVQQAEGQLRLILESTADGLFGVDSTGRVTFVNPSACSMLARDADSLMGQPAHALLPPEGNDGQPFAPEASPLHLTLRNGLAARVERAIVRRPGGQQLLVRYEARAMWQQGHIVGAVVSFSDITERIAAEQAREAALAEAERLARVRTDFLANMSHEIRTPLNAVLGLAEVAARGDRDHTPAETFAMILDAGQMLLGVVNDILDFSKIEAGKLRLESQLFELGAVIDRAVSLVAPRVFAKGLHFWVDEAVDLPVRLRGDPLRVTQVLSNLLSNASKFTEDGGVELRVWADENDLWFTVRDSGIGIAPEQLQRLFSPFEQADSSTTRRYGGSGLGLVISRHLLDLMGGVITVRSEPGIGSTFSVRIPLIDAQPAAPPPRSANVLLAGPVTQAHVMEALRQQGHMVRSLPAGQALNQPADLVVLPADSLQEEHLCDAALAASSHGVRIAAVTHALASELPAPLRGMVKLLEAPLRARHVQACLTGTPQREAPVDSGGRLARLTVLAAEDNEVNALVLEAIMRMEGAHLTLVDNGRLAVQHVRDAGPGYFDLALTDIQMPEMDGYDATRAMLALDPSLPVIGLTAHAMPEERERCIAAGMVDHLAKPVDVEQLVATALRHARREA